MAVFNNYASAGGFRDFREMSTLGEVENVFFREVGVSPGAALLVPLTTRNLYHAIRLILLCETPTRAAATLS